MLRSIHLLLEAVVNLVFARLSIISAVAGHVASVGDQLLHHMFGAGGGCSALYFSRALTHLCPILDQRDAAHIAAEVKERNR